MDFIARVNPKYLAAVSCFMAHRDIRYYLNGILIEPHPKGGVVIVATNGYVVGAMHDPEGFAKDAIIVSPDSAILKACRLKSWQKNYIPNAVWISQRCAVVTASQTTLQTEEPPELFGAMTIATAGVEIIDGKFPNWVRIMDCGKPNKGEDVPYPTLAAGVLEPFLKAAEILHPKYPTVHMTPSGDSASVRIRIRTSHSDVTDNFFGMAMPMRADQPAGFCPEWLGLMPVPEKL